MLEYTVSIIRRRRVLLLCSAFTPCDKWVPVATAWCILRLRMEEQPPGWRLAAKILNKQSRTADKEWSSSFSGIGRGANNSSPLKRILLRNSQTKPPTWTDTSVRTKQRKRDMRFGTWNVRNLYRAGALRQQPGNWLDIN